MGSRGASADTGRGRAVSPAVAGPLNGAQISGPSRVIQVLDGKGDVVFEGVFNDYQDFVKRGDFKDDYSTRVVRKERGK